MSLARQLQILRWGGPGAAARVALVGCGPARCAVCGQAVGEQDREMDYVVDGKEVLANCDDVLVGEEGDECAVIEHADARQIPKGEELDKHISPFTPCPPEINRFPKNNRAGAGATQGSLADCSCRVEEETVSAPGR